MAFDHGVLNLPLAKRCDIDKQIDAFKRDQARSTAARLKEARRRHRAALALAKEAIAQVSDERMAALGKAHGLTVKQTRAQFVTAATINPERVAKAMQRELAPKEA